jgi:hypothetical protein
MAAPSIPFTRGQNVILKLFQDGSPIVFAAKNWKVEENALEANDGVNGEIRDRLDKVTNYYSGTVDIYTENKDVMQTILDAQDANDAQGFPLKQSAAVLKKHRDGTRAAYMMQEAVFGPWADDAPGRAENNMIQLKFRFRYWKAVPTL